MLQKLIISVAPLLPPVSDIRVGAAAQDFGPFLRSRGGALKKRWLSLDFAGIKWGKVFIDNLIRYVIN